MKLRFIFAVLILVIFSSAQAQFFSSPDDSTKKQEGKFFGTLTRPKQFNRQMLLGNILKMNLESTHYSGKRIDDQFSKHAFELYLERIDFGKQFLIQSDIKELRGYEKSLDDQLVSGKLNIVEASSKILTTRIKEVQGYIEEILKQPFNYQAAETLETDPEKRKFVATTKELRSLWEKLLRYETLGRISDLKQEKEDALKNQKENKPADESAKKKKKKKSFADGDDLTKLSDADIEVKARKKVQESYKKILTRLVSESISDKEEKFYNSITHVFDPHTSYLPPEEKQDFDIDMSGKLEGIGAILREDGSYIKVESIVPGSASWKTKQLDADDTILKVAQGSDEPVDVVDMSLREAVKLIRGKKGTEVRLTVKKANGIIKVVPIVRDVVQIEESYVKSTVIDLPSKKLKVGYINIPKFYRDFSDRSGRNCTDDTRRELQKLTSRGVSGVILDLRNNGGGALEDAKLISGLFIDKGPVVQVKATGNSIDVLEDSDGKIEFEKPLIVLINRFSASASEIVAAALQDYKRAIIVGGEFTHGKGTVQMVVELDNNAPMIARDMPLGALKVTIQKFYRIDGGSTQYRGVTPDVILPDPYAYMETGEKFLKFSIPWGEVKPLKFKPLKPTYDVKKILLNSKKRVTQNPRFKKMMDVIAWYKTRKDKTVRSLKESDFVTERKELEKKSEELKEEVENKDLVIEFAESPADPVQKEKQDDFAKELRQDPTIEESVYIIADMLGV